MPLCSNYHSTHDSRDHQRPTVLSHRLVKALISSKGWSLSNLAWRWQITPGYLCALMANQDRAPHWNDALWGLPEISRLQARAIEIERKTHSRAPRSRQKKSRIEVIHEAGDVFVSTDLVGAGEGYRYVITSPEVVTNDYFGDIVLKAIDFEDFVYVKKADLLALFSETGSRL